MRCLNAACQLAVKNIDITTTASQADRPITPRERNRRPPPRRATKIYSRRSTLPRWLSVDGLFKTYAPLFFPSSLSRVDRTFAVANRILDACTWYRGVLGD